MRLRLLKLQRATWRLIGGSLALLALLSLSTSRAPTTLETVQANGVLRMATLPGPTTYFESARGKNGLDYLLAKAFADSLGVRLEVAPMNNLNSLFIALGGPRADFAAAGLAITPSRLKYARFSQPYTQVVQKLLYRRGTKRPRSLADVSDGRLVAIANSAHAEQLQTLKQEHAELTWEEYPNAEMIELMEMVHQGDIQYAVVDSIAYDINRSLYPRARAAFDISQPQPLAWAFPPYGDDSLIQAANRFLADMAASGELTQLIDGFFSRVIANISVPDSQLFMRRVQSRLPTYETLFKTVAGELGIDWHLLAAMAYQESHWNPNAKSYTGVRGLMMLTRETAGELGVKNRRNPKQSLRGGATYFMDIKARLPADITDPDRTWLALAAYNIGLGHLEDARILTQRAGKNPDLWEDVRDHLPLLQRQKHYSTLKHGYARGGEAQAFVQNIRQYQRILQWYSLEQKRRAEKAKANGWPYADGWPESSLMPL